jgi:Tol biopolymer transport system component
VAVLPTSWDLCVLGIATQTPRRIHTTAGNAGSVSWSADGTWLAYVTPGDGWGQAKGLYLWSLERGTTHRVQHGRYGSIAWSPDQTRLAAITYGKTAELWVYDVATLVAPADP